MLPFRESRYQSRPTIVAAWAKGAIIVSGRILLAITLAAISGGTQASSLVFPGAPASTPSILMLRADDTAKAGDMMSVVAVGEPDVTYEKVSAISNETGASHSFMQGPMIIRGGAVGGAFSPPTQAKAAAVTPAPTKASAAPAAGVGKAK